MMSGYSWHLLLSFFVATSFALNPVVFFPGYALETIEVTISGAHIEGCPTSGSFQIFWQYEESDLNGIPEECVPKYLTLQYTESSGRISNQDGVTLSIPGREIGDANALHSLYTPLIQYFTDRGYTIGDDRATFRAMGYDWRTVPYLDVTDGGLDDPGFLELTEDIIKAAYESAGKEKVYLIGHSNGPIMSHYFLTNIGQSFRDKYIAGSITLSGNFAGQGLGSVAPILGFGPKDFAFNTDWTDACESFPSSYMSAAQPDIFSGDNEIVVVRANHKDYTTQEYDQLYTAAGADFALEHWREWISVVTPTTTPYGGGVQQFSFYGEGFDSAVGVVVDGVPINKFDATNSDNFLFLPGDQNQEAIDNESVLVWQDLMPKGCFNYQVNEGLDHFGQCADAGVIEKIYQIVSGPVSKRDCSAGRTLSYTTVGTSDFSTVTIATSPGTSDASVLCASLFALLVVALSLF